MPDKTFNILSCTIDQDQFDVATQWSRTFLYNPSADVASNMAQIVMACIARGNFKTRAYLSKTDDLQAPTQQLTIADYLSHGSRIIVDYKSLSPELVLELLSYFPEPHPSNAVFSRSATHNVNQVDEDIIEGKSFVIGVAGQLPSMIKTPYDFGINIAMGGSGQDNFYGKKIAANGFSGHFYFHHNKEHKLLMVGLEQTAPAASAFELVIGTHKYAQEEQQGQDQFGQGHSLRGASDTYTAAGSLYFSNPLYQAKLLLEKGVFPPDKYGAMQVTITDENWPKIKAYLDSIKLRIRHSSQDELTQQLLEKPISAVQTAKDYESYIALDFHSYMKQAYQVFILQTKLSEQEKTNFARMQTELLEIIKKLQLGDINGLGRFHEVIEKITNTNTIPQEYQHAVRRISELFKLHLKIDPQLKNTKVNKKYQFGDHTHTLLSGVNQYFHPEDEKPYRFGNITRNVISKWSQPANQEPQTAQRGYRIGDITRSLIWGRKTTATTSDVQAENQPK